MTAAPVGARAPDAARTVPMRVLVLGFCRTGTASMRVALETLGFRDTHHMASVFQNPAEIAIWNTALDAKFLGRGTPYGRAEWDRLLGHCQAVTDLPGILFADELLAAYPDAKVVLTMRDPARWYVSYRASLHAFYHSRRLALACLLDARFGATLRFGQRCAGLALGSPDAPEAAATARFVAHYEHVRAVVPQERLLEYEVGEGWARLCAFLGVEEPGEPFPRTNDTREIRAKMDERSAQIFRVAARRLVGPVVLVVAVCAGLYAKRRGLW
ncbi:P-loop containing nucleoside triphosphate hydrolase protein [Mycena belliarum]|uniref:P-loop containing nucleoside triphosphate hydrolase protein n=1 Tax=Mycena belliarum TaxID=1033014 RepID=A0AAD6U9R2_9AGAR|nr:P-loop containing nucleoside triphosphate hydrolase protein [Mycena belliae]